VVFVFEGPGIEGLVRDLVNDPARSVERKAHPAFPAGEESP
jgi:hypothetical protein